MRSFGANLRWNPWNGPLRWPARVLGVFCAAVYIVGAETGRGAFDHVAKYLFWTGCVFLPLAGLNRDLYRIPLAWLIIVTLAIMQAILVAELGPSLTKLTFIAFAPLCIVQIILFGVPFIWLRNRIGIKYPSQS